MKSKLSRRASVHLDLLRGAAALAVLANHVRGLFFVDYPYISRPTPFFQVLYGLTGFGHQAVIVFFVLSGYLIGTSARESVAGRRWSWRIYLTNRITRLQLVLLPALLLGFVWDQMGMRVPGAASLYYGGLYKFYLPSVAARSTAPVFFGNLFFLQDIISPVFGSNGPLWSLSYEFWYYLLFPALTLAVVSWLGLRARIFYFGLAAVMAWFVGRQISLYFLIWLMGTLIGALPRLGWLKSARVAAVASLFAALPFAVALAWVRIHPQRAEVAGDFAVAVGCSLWIYSLLQIRREDVSRTYAKIAKTLAGFSYTLYLLHFPALLLLRAAWDTSGNWQPDLRHLTYAAGIMLLMLCYAYLVAEFTEARTASVRRRLLQPWAPLSKEATQ